MAGVWVTWLGTGYTWPGLGSGYVFSTRSKPLPQAWVWLGFLVSFLIFSFIFSLLISFYFSGHSAIYSLLTDMATPGHTTDGHDDNNLSTQLPIPLSNGCPLPRGLGPLGPTTCHLPTATRASMRGRTGHVDAALYLLHANGHPSLKGPPCPTTDGNDGNDTWQGQDTLMPPTRAALCPSPPRGCSHNQWP